MSSVVMVTGVSSGIGKAVAKQLLEYSYEVVGLSRRCADELKKSFADRFVQENIDLSDLTALKNHLPILAKRYTDVDAIVFCAGYGRFGSLAMEPIIAMAEYFVETVKSLDHVWLELRTKSTQIRSLLNPVSYTHLTLPTKA